MKKIAEKDFISIGKAAKIIGVATHTIRFWQQQFPQIKYKIGKGNRKYYNQAAIDQFVQIKHLMYDKGMKIAGIQKMFLGDMEEIVTVVTEEECKEVASREFNLLNWQNFVINDSLKASDKKICVEDILGNVAYVKTLLSKIK